MAGAIRGCMSGVISRTLSGVMSGATPRAMPGVMFGGGVGRVLLGVIAGLALTPLSGIVSGPIAQAFIPDAGRTMKAIARVNRSSGRSQAFQLELTMRIGDRPPIAQGQLITHPSGLARLELRGYNGRVDRYLLSGRELLGAKDGVRLDRPQPMLQPLFFLQPSSEETLRAALEAFGILSDSIGLAPCGEQDCFVIGDPRLAAPLPEAARVSGLAEREVLEDPLEAKLSIDGLEAVGEDAAGDLSEVDLGALLEGPELVIGGDALLPRLWVDTEDLQVRRIDRASGVFTIFGPIVSFDKLRVPAWFEIHEPGTDPIRFEVDRAVQMNAPPQAFSRKWLLAPIDPPEPGADVGDSRGDSGASTSPVQRSN